MRREDHCTKLHWRFKEEGRSSSQAFLYSKGRYAVYRSFAYFCEVKKIALWILLTVYGFFALSPTLYIHGCCCGVVQQWIIPPADCCENDPDHHHQIQLDCCQEESVSFHLDANQLPSIFSLSFFNESIATQSFFHVAWWEDSISSAVKAININPPPLLKRFIRFHSIKIFDVLKG